MREGEATPLGLGVAALPTDHDHHADQQLRVVPDPAEVDRLIAVEGAHQAGALGARAACREGVFDQVMQIGPGGGLARPAQLAGSVIQRDAVGAWQKRPHQLYVGLEGAPRIGSRCALVQVSHPRRPWYPKDLGLPPRSQTGWYRSLRELAISAESGRRPWTKVEPLHIRPPQIGGGLSPLQGSAALNQGLGSTGLPPLRISKY